MTKTVSYYIAHAVFFMVFCCLPQPAGAVEIIQIDRPKVRVIIPPGEMKTGIINVANPSSEPKEVRLYLEDWLYLPGADGSKEFRPANTLPNSCASWINFHPSEFTLQPYAKQIVGYTIRTPEDAKGGYYAILFFENTTSKPETAEGVGINLAIRFGTLFYIEPSGTITREAKIENLLLEKEDSSLKVSADFKNTGNIDLITSGTFDIIDSSGIVFARGEFNDTYTMSGDNARLVSEWNKTIPTGKYDLILTIDLGKALEELNLGRGPVITKEAQIEIGTRGEILSIGELK